MHSDRFLYPMDFDPEAYTKGSLKRADEHERALFSRLVERLAWFLAGMALTAGAFWYVGVL